ncbi:MAG: ABC transporter permease [Mailhella sp.]|nr:ABC transporter permease [Mailhella sp.]
MSPVYILKRFCFMLMTLFCISIIIFFVTMILPGNVAQVILGEFATDDALHALEEQLGLNLPFYEQYGRWIWGVLHGDFGKALSMDQPIVPLLLFRLKNSAVLAFFSIIIVTFIAIPLGVYAALHRNKFSDRAIQVGSYIGISVPEFATASLLIIFFAGPVFNIFPSTGYVSIFDDPLRALMHIVLPVMTLVIVLIAHIMRQTRSEMIQVMQSDYIRSARLRGLSYHMVVYKHALRNALMPTITVLALDVGYLIGSVVVIEEVFAYPGIGRLLVYAVTSRDVPLLQATVLTVACVYCLVNFLADLAYGWVNPRIRYK